MTRPLLRACLLTGPQPEAVHLHAAPRLLRGSDGAEDAGIALLLADGRPVLALTVREASDLVEALLAILHPAAVEGPAPTDALRNLALPELRRLAGALGYHEIPYRNRKKATRTWGSVQDGLWYVSWAPRPPDHAGSWSEWEWWDGHEWQEAGSELVCWRGVLLDHEPAELAHALASVFKPSEAP